VSASPLRASARPIPGGLPARVRIAVAHHLPNVQPPRRRSTRTTPPRIRRRVAGGCPHSAAVPKGPTSHNVLRRIPLPHQSSGGCALSTKPVRKCVPADLSGPGDTHYPHTSWQVEMVEVTAAAIEHFIWRRASESGYPYIPGQGCLRVHRAFRGPPRLHSRWPFRQRGRHPSSFSPNCFRARGLLRRKCGIDHGGSSAGRPADIPATASSEPDTCAIETIPTICVAPQRLAGCHMYSERSWRSAPRCCCCARRIR
jgi:hypothetical protein